MGPLPVGQLHPWNFPWNDWVPTAKARFIVNSVGDGVAVQGLWGPRSKQQKIKERRRKEGEKRKRMAGPSPDFRCPSLMACPACHPIDRGPPASSSLLPRAYTCTRGGSARQSGPAKSRHHLRAQCQPRTLRKSAQGFNEPARTRHGPDMRV